MNAHNRTSPENRKKAKLLSEKEAADRAKRGVNVGLNPKEIATLEGLEQRNSTRKTEQMNIVDENGNVIFSKNGTKGRVKIYPYEGVKMENKVVTHNHPGGEFGSGMGARIGVAVNGHDVSTAMIYNAKEIRASTEGYVFSVKRPKGGWRGNPSSVAKDFDRAFSASKKDALKYVAKAHGEHQYVRLGRANASILNSIMKQLSKKYGFIYTRKKR